MISGRDFIFSNWALYLSNVQINPFLFLMNACLFYTAFNSSSLFLIKTESTLQTVKVDFFSDKLRLALDTLIGLGFAVASERVFFPGLAEVFFRLGVGFLLFIGSAVGVENSALDVSEMSVELLGISGGGRLGRPNILRSDVLKREEEMRGLWEMRGLTTRKYMNCRYK